MSGFSKRERRSPKIIIGKVLSEREGGLLPTSVAEAGWVEGKEIRGVGGPKRIAQKMFKNVKKGGANA